MKTKLKDFLLYSMACIGAVSLFLSAYQPKQSTTTVPSSHVWEMNSTSNDNTSFVFAINKVTGEVRKYETKYTHIGSKTYFAHYEIASE